MMKKPESKISGIEANKNPSFFSKDGGQDFFRPIQRGASFFSKNNYADNSDQTNRALTGNITPVIQTKGVSGGQEENRIQRQERPDEPVPKDVSPGTTELPAPKPPLATRCSTNPELPDFGCLAGQLKLDIDENLWNNAPQFYRVASLYPGNNELMWNTFLRYGLGVNLLQTGFGFLGTGKKWGSILSYGTGIALKSYDFFQNGQLKLDIPIPLGKDTSLDIKFDLSADPNNLTNVKGVDTTVGITRRF